MSGTRVAGHQNCTICHPDFKGEADGRPRPPSRKGTFAMPARDRRRVEPPAFRPQSLDERYGEYDRLDPLNEYARRDDLSAYDAPPWEWQ